VRLSLALAGPVLAGTTAAPRVIFPIPIEGRVVEAQLQTMLFASRSQLLQRIFAIRCVRYFPIAVAGVPVAETIVVAGNEHDVFHARIFGREYPLLRIKIKRVKHPDVTLVIFFANLSVVHHPFAIAQHTAQAPVYKHPVFMILKVGSGLQVVRTGLVVGLAVGQQAATQ